MIDQAIVKRESEAYILAQGGKICDWLPSIGPEEIVLRKSEDIACRALALNILVNIRFKAPVALAHEWLTNYNLLSALTPRELSIVTSSSEPSQETINYLSWYIESLTAAAWVGGLEEMLSPLSQIPDSLASHFPSLKDNESPAPFFSKFLLQPQDELLRKLDLFYRAHWYTRDSDLTGYQCHPFNLGVVQQRRHFLEWVLHDGTEWEDVELST
jgi:Domain of unknown function (DUF4272)